MPHSYAGRQPKFGVAQTLLRGWNISLITHLYTLPFLGLSPTLTGDHMLLRELVAVNQTTCPIQNGSYTHLLHLPAPPQLARLLMLSSHPLPCRAQGKLGLQGLREEVRRGWGTPSLVPTAMWSMGKPVPPPLSCQMAQGPVGRHHCSLLPVPLPLFSALRATSLTIHVPPQPGEATVSP